MNGYLMKEEKWVPGKDLFVESFSPENRYGVVFEDDGEAAYFYAVEKDQEGAGLNILDALHIDEAGDYDEDDETEEAPDGGVGESRAAGEGDDEDATFEEGTADEANSLVIIWSKDWMACALVIDGYCHALFDFAAHGGYNINEFPPPNDIWTKGDRKLTDEIVRRLF